MIKIFDYEKNEVVDTVEKINNLDGFFPYNKENGFHQGVVALKDGRIAYIEYTDFKDEDILNEERALIITDKQALHYIINAEKFEIFSQKGFEKIEKLLNLF